MAGESNMRKFLNILLDAIAYIMMGLLMAIVIYATLIGIEMGDLSHGIFYYLK